MENNGTNEELSELRARELKAILHISNMVGSVLKHEDILRIICDTTAEAMEVSVCSIYLLEPAHNRLRLAATHGLNPAVVGRATLKVGEGIPGWVAEQGRLLALTNGPADARFAPIQGSDEEAYLAYLCAPLYIQTELIGVMTARKIGEYDFTEQDTMLFETICKQAAIVMEKARLYSDKIEAERLAAIGQSLAEISHYIKNVLQSIRGGAYFIDSGLSRDDLNRTRHGWQILKRSNRKIGYLVENMLNFSRTTKPKLEKLSLEELVMEVLDSAEESALRRDIVLEPEIEPGLPEIESDYEGVYNAVLNLVTNAFDALEDRTDGVVKIALRKDPTRPGFLALTVSDNGPGVSDEIRERIYDMFFSTKGRNGTGIGLAVTRKIMQESGGEITLDQAPGEGATFTLHFPIEVVRTESAATSGL